MKKIKISQYVVLKNYSVIKEGQLVGNVKVLPYAISKKQYFKNN